AGDYTPRNLKCLAEDGRIAMIALLGGARSDVDLGLILRRRLTLTGSTLRPRTTALKGRIAASPRGRGPALFEACKIRPVVHATFGLKDAAQAHAMMEAGDQIGKIVLTV